MIKTLKKYFSFLLRRKKLFFAYVLVSTIATVASSINPYLYKLMVNAIPSGDYNLLLRIVFLFAGLRLTSNYLSVLGHYLGDKTAIPAANYIREKVFNHVQELDWAFHTNKKTGSLVSVFKRGGHAFWSFFMNTRNIFEIAVGFTVGLIFFGNLSFWLLATLGVLFILNSTAGYFLIKRNVQRRREVNATEDRVTGVIADNFLNYETVKYFAGEEREKERLNKELGHLEQKTWGYANSFRLMDLVIGTISFGGMLTILLLSLNFLKRGMITNGDMVMVASFLTSIYYQLFRLLYQARNIAKDFTDLSRYFNLLEQVTQIEDPARPQKIENPEGKIVFENVTFDYPQGKEEAVRNINLTINPGEVIAFVGKSGAGKTTLAKLLFRLYKLKEGQILIDGIDIKNMRKKDLRTLVGIVPQEPILFNRTIGFNITFGNPSAGEEEIEEAVEVANIYQFIQSLPEKFETEVGERGIKLSGGQKQRLAIARMILADPKIIIFDEATSQLDSESEALIQEALWKIAEGRTVLIIAHRFSTIMGADRIVVLKDGRVVEKGSHRELIQKQGAYHHLWELQTQK